MTTANDASRSLTAYDVAYRDAPDAALSSGLDAALAGGTTLTVTAARGIEDVVRQVQVTRPDVVVVLDASRAPCGYIFPDWVVHQVVGQSGPGVRSFDEAIRRLAAERRDYTRDHLHEWLNFARPPINTCPGRLPAEGAHVTFGPVPCSRHR